MAVYKRGYQRYQGPLTGHWTRFMALPRFAWKRLMAQRLVVILLAISMIWPLLCGVFLYVSNHADLWKGFAPGMARFLDVNATFFTVFMNAQNVFALLLAALAGPGLIAPDLANNGLPLYFSRPISRAEYLLVRLAVLAGLLSLVTWVPGLLLFGIQSGMAGWNWASANWRLGVGVVAGFFIWIVIVGLVALASSAYVRWRVVAGALVLGFFFVSAGVAAIVNQVFRVDWGSLLNPSKAMYSVWCAMLGAEPPSGPGAWECGASLVVLALLLLVILERKLRPVEVVS